MFYKIKIVTLLILLIALPGNVSAGTDSLNTEEKNYCNDPDANMQWEALVHEHPDDIQIHALHALRLGLCFKVDRGDLTVSQATEIFENIRSALINAKANKMEKELEEDKNQKKDL